MSIRASELATCIAVRVNPFLPDGFRVVAERGTLRIQSSTRWMSVTCDLRDFLDSVEDPLESPEAGVPVDYVLDQAASAVLSFLTTLQEYISEELTVPWPQDRAAARLAMAMPFVTVEGKTLRSGFGQPEQVSVEFPAIELATLVR